MTTLSSPSLLFGARFTTKPGKDITFVAPPSGKEFKVLNKWGEQGIYTGSAGDHLAFMPSRPVDEAVFAIKPEALEDKYQSLPGVPYAFVKKGGVPQEIFLPKEGGESIVTAEGNSTIVTRDEAVLGKDAAGKLYPIPLDHAYKTYAPDPTDEEAIEIQKHIESLVAPKAD